MTRFSKKYPTPRWWHYILRPIRMSTWYYDEAQEIAQHYNEAQEIAHSGRDDREPDTFMPHLGRSFNHDGWTVSRAHSGRADG